MFSQSLLDRSAGILDIARSLKLRLATAESCTGGLVAGVLTEIAGSSDVFDRGFVTYSNDAKRDLLGVPETLLVEFGAVSEPVARAMAEGAVSRSLAEIAVAITGVAGPGGGSPEKPVGHVQFAAARAGKPTIARLCQFGPRTRSEIRLLSVGIALDLVEAQLSVR